MNQRTPLVVGDQWQRFKDGRIVKIIGLTDVGSPRNPYFDVAWETVDTPRRKGCSFEDYWRRDYGKIPIG